MENEGDSGGGGGEGTSAAAANRWPQEETLALLNIRLEMDPAFRDAAVKSSLWDEISRRLAQLGYYRSAAKCKEKFENLYKYHKRTKQNRMARSNAKTYKFFDQLEALDHQFSLPCPANSGTTMTSTPIFVHRENTVPCIQSPMPNSLQYLASNLDVSTSASSGDEEYEGSRKMKRKWKEFFGSIMNIVLQKQEDLHKKFLEAMDRCECERIAREEAWKTHEMGRIKREQELLEQERVIAASKDAAVIAFLQKISEKGKCFGTETTPLPLSGEDEDTIHSIHYSGGSRWPKEEVDALIKIRTDMEIKYKGDGPKGLWDEISASMKKLGYDRNTKRCKEKWENINKYYRRVKESNKKRPIDSKTCSYFQQLETLYNIKSQKHDNNLDNSFRPEELLMHMMNHHREQEQKQEQHKKQRQEQGGSMLDREASENVDQTRDDEDYEEEEEEADHQMDTSTRSIMT